MRSTKAVITNTYDSPCGEITLGSYDGKLCLCDWTESRHRRTVDNRLQKLLVARYEEGLTPVIEETASQLSEYFDGVRRTFDLDLLIIGTDFQRKVWEYLTQIPYGETTSYSSLTCACANEADIRAVSNAVGANALSIIIPCHRVIGTRGKLTGYAGGLLAKQYLIDLEKTYLAIEKADEDAIAKAQNEFAARAAEHF